MFDHKNKKKEFVKQLQLHHALESALHTLQNKQYKLKYSVCCVLLK